MTSPYSSARHFSYAQAPYLLPTPKPPKPPIHNPYDKFTQPEFDSWIGGITNSIKRALGQEPVIEQEPGVDEPYFTPTSGGIEAELPDDSESIDEAVDDSFAEVKARRALGKGKARDPRDGPGFGTGDIHQPIEIDLDSGSEQEQEVEGSEEEEEGSEDWDEEENSGEEGEQEWAAGESSAQAQIRRGRRDVDPADGDEIQSDQEYSEEEEPEAPGEVDEENILLLSDEDERDDGVEDDEEDELERDETPARTRGIRSGHDEGVDDEDLYESDLEVQEAEYISDSDDVDGAEQDKAEDKNPQIFELLDEEDFTPPRHPHGPSIISPASFAVLEDQDASFDESPHHTVNAIDVRNVAEHRSISAHFDGLTDAPTSSPNVRATSLLPDNLSHEVMEAAVSEPKSDYPGTAQQEIYEIDEDEDQEDVAVSLEDRTGEDKDAFSSVPFFSSAEPHHHAAADEQPLVYDVDMDEENDELEATVTQPITEDTSFPPHEAFPVSIDVGALVEISDVWAGPETYAEDYYAGGDVRPEPDVELSADYLGVGDKDINTSMPEPIAIAETEPHDVIVIDSPEESPRVSLDELPESLEKVAQPGGEMQVIEGVDKSAPSPPRSPVPEILGSQDDQLTQGLSFDDLYDIDMASYDTSTFSVEQTVDSWDFSGIPGMISTPAFLPPLQEIITPTTVEAGIQPVELSEESHARGSRAGLEEIEFYQPVEVEKPAEVQELSAMDELAEAPRPVDFEESDEAQGSAQELTVEKEVSVATPQPEEPQEVVELVATQDVVEMYIQDDEIEAVQDHLKSQSVESDIGIVVTSESGRDLSEDQQDTHLTVWDEPSIRIEPPSPIPPDTPTTEEQQSFEGQSEELPTQPEPLIPVNDQKKSDSTFVSAMEAKYENTNNRHDIENGLPTPPFEPMFEAIDVDALPENPPPSTSDPTPEYEIIIDEDSDGEDDLTTHKTVSHEANMIEHGALEAPKNIDTVALTSDVPDHSIGPQTDGVPPLSDLSPDASTPQEVAPPSPQFPVSFEHHPDLANLQDLEDKVSQEDPQPPQIASTSSPTPENMPVYAGTPIPEPTSPPQPPTAETPSKFSTPTALSIITKPSQPPISFPAPPPDPHLMRVVMRKPTHPVLLSDPYPYSMSTPDYVTNVAKYGIYEPSEDEMTEQDNSLSSSSTFDKDAEEREKDLNGDSTGSSTRPDFFDIDLRYPSDSPTDPTNHPLGKIPQTSNFHNDTDAGGGADSISHIPTPQPPVIPVHAKDDPFITASPTIPDTRGNAEKRTLDQQKSSGSPTPKTPTFLTTNGSGSTTFGSSVDGLPSILIVKPKPPRVQIPFEEDLEELTELEDSPPQAPKPPRPQKRKLSASFLQGFSPITRSMATKTPELSGSSLVKSAMKQIGSKTSKPASSLAKGKRKARSDRQDSDQASESGKSSGSASKIPRRDTNASRESSIASSAPSDKSSVIHQSSPTLNKPITSRQPAPPPPPPFPPPLMHTHSHAFRHVHHLPSAPQQPRIQTHVRKASSLGSPAGESSTAKPASSQHPARGASFFASSPVTRSNCRYHKISIPKEEDEPDGPRVYFIIPGCSLGDKKLIDEEFILDHGDATHEDSLRMVQDMEGWGVHPYIIGVLRVMAGVDTTRERDFYYLPQPGEKRPEPKGSPEKSTSVKHPSRGHHEHNAPHGSPRTPAVSNPSPTSSKAPISTASNSTTSTKESLGGTKRGLKRSRTSDVYGGEEALDRGQKKPKARQTEWWRDD